MDVCRYCARAIATIAGEEPDVVGEGHRDACTQRRRRAVQRIPPIFRAPVCSVAEFTLRSLPVAEHHSLRGDRARGWSKVADQPWQARLGGDQNGDALAET